MPVTLGQFKENLRSELKRGTSLDIHLQGKIRQAVLWLERRRTWCYMERFGTLTISASSSNPRIIDFPSGKTKSISFFRLLTQETSGTRYSYLKYVDPLDVPSITPGKPLAYWRDGVQRLILDTTPEQDYSAEIRWEQFSDFPNDDNFTHWLLDQGEDVLLALTMRGFAPLIRDKAVLDMYTSLLTDGLATLEDSDEELKYNHQRMVMGYNVDSYP